MADLPDGYNIRAAEPADAAAVRALVFGTLAEYGLTADPAGTDADLTDLMGHYAELGGAFEVLTGPDGGVVGSVGLAPYGNGRCELRKMYLAPAARGRGMGRRLLTHALVRAAGLGFRRVELETAGVLREAVGLYTAAGFREFVSEHLSPRCDRAYYLDLAPDAKPGGGAKGTFQ